MIFVATAYCPPSAQASFGNNRRQLKYTPLRGSMLVGSARRGFQGSRVRVTGHGCFPKIEIRVAARSCVLITGLESLFAGFCSWRAPGPLRRLPWPVAFADSEVARFFFPAGAFLPGSLALHFLVVPCATLMALRALCSASWKL